MTQREVSIARVLECATPDMVQGDDGFYVWWPTSGHGGAHAAWHLRVIADELDKRNAPWEAEIARHFA